MAEHLPLRHERPAPAPGGIAARALGARSAGYLADLNPEQRQAVETLDGPVLVLAGAGTGKTRVLTSRIAHILSMGRARPGEILSVTFTNKAAREMKLRLGHMLGQAVEGMPWLGTFHSIGGRILRTHAELVHATEGWVSATCESMTLHVDMTTKKVAPWPADVLDALENMKLGHERLPVPEGVGRKVAMPEKRG